MGRPVPSLSVPPLEKERWLYKEFGLLEVLMKKSGRVLSRQFLLEYVWGYEEEVLTRTIDMHIARLRQKLGDEGRERIQTVERFGYRFSDE